MKLGYVLRGNFNAAYFFGADKVAPLCKRCGRCLDYNYCPNNIEIHRSKRYGVSATYDGRLLYSREFVEFCRDVLKTKQEFHCIDGDGVELFYMFPESVVQFDAERSRTEFGPICSTCGKHEWVVGAIPAYLKMQLPLENKFYRTDLMFGSGVNTFPLILVGREWKELLSRKKFRGLDFREIVK